MLSSVLRVIRPLEIAVYVALSFVAIHVSQQATGLAWKSISLSISWLSWVGHLDSR